MEEINTRILLAEDDQNLGNLLREYLKAKSYNVDLYPDGEKAYKGFKTQPYDLCILDVMMPVKDGFSLARDIRFINSDIPIIFLTAKSMKEDVFEGFKLGADDYISKPFNMEELLFRIEAILRRVKKEDADNHIFKLGNYIFDSNRQVLLYGNEEQKLTTKESELLKLLSLNINKILERNYALRTIWVDDTYFNARSMDVYITKLRKYLKKDPSIQILNIHGKGFKFLID